jgi:hypothetical protein
MQQRFLLQILLLAQHVSGTTVPIIGNSRVLYSGCCLWYFVLWFSSFWSGVELRVMCPVCRMQPRSLLIYYRLAMHGNSNIVNYTLKTACNIQKNMSNHLFPE